ncbi:MAG: amidohydrolase family protein [Phycisphaeraceae bacterium]|nr:amidohydrolase family protein [Phycisphaeraceae bacterium]
MDCPPGPFARRGIRGAGRTVRRGGVERRGAAGLHAGAAYVAFWAGITGSIAPGKEADFIVVDRDPLTCEPGEIPGTRVLRRVIGGERVFEDEPRE